MQRIQLYKGIKRMTILWFGCFMFLLVLLIIQTFTGKYEDQSGSAWKWLIMHILPVTLLLLLGYFRHRNLAQIILSNTDSLLFRLVYWMSWIYLLCAMTIFLLQPFGKADASEAENLHITDTGLFVFQIILLFAFGILTYKTEKNVRVLIEEEKDGGTSNDLGVFISYNHSDIQVADELKKMLEKQNVNVTIDHDAMKAGTDIKSFIEKGIFSNRVVISIVSNKSLLSGWVGMETINTFFLQKFLKKKLFIGCYVEDDFFKPDFTANAVTAFDAQLTELNDLMKKHNELGIDTRDLNDGKSRLLAIRNNLDEIIGKLRGNLCVDIRNEKLKENFPLIIKSIFPDNE